MGDLAALSPTIKANESPNARDSADLDQISESDSEEDDTEAKKYVRYQDNGKTVEIISPRMQGILKIKEPKVNIMPNPTKFLELKHIE